MDIFVLIIPKLGEEKKKFELKMDFPKTFQCSKCILMLSQHRLNMFHPANYIFSKKLSLCKVFKLSKHIIVSPIFCLLFQHSFG